ncbi:MAG: hypothetical protein Q8Q00_04705 [Dehalococcoidia bacterium]|nr:hypothetical protein [Dehalococcoidia bacterium]
MRTIPLFIGALLLLAMAWSAHIAVGANAQANPGLAKLEIDIWPEFDRAATLVILRGEIAPDVTLPASVSLRIPTASGGPTALASAVSADAPLLTIPYERSEVQVDFLTLTFKTETRFFQLEFYDRLKTDSASRSYRYIWTGDLVVGQLIVQLQEPAGATELSVRPDLGPDFAGPNGLVYREADLGALEQGKALTVDVAYKKSDSRTSAEILGLATGAPEPGNSGSDGGLPRWLIFAAGAGALVLAAAGLTLWLRRRSPV